MKSKLFVSLSCLAALVAAAVSFAPAQNTGDDAGRIQALELAWNHALEAKDANALDMLLASTMISADIDGSIMNKNEFLASIKSPDYQPSQAVTEQSSVQMYRYAAVVAGIFRVKGSDKGKPYLHRERFLDTWIKINGTWQCVATTAALIPAKAATD